MSFTPSHNDSTSQAQLKSIESLVSTLQQKINSGELTKATITPLIAEIMGIVSQEADPSVTGPPPLSATSDIRHKVDIDDDNMSEERSFISIEAVKSTTIHDFLLSCGPTAPVVDSGSMPSSRAPRAVEMALKERDQLTSIVYCPDLGDHAHDFLSTKEDLRQVLMTDAVFRRITAGPICGNMCEAAKSEGDVEYICRTTQATVVCESINALLGPSTERLFPTRGTIVPRNQRIPGREHAYADLEIKDMPLEVKKKYAINESYERQMLNLSKLKLSQMQDEIRDNQAIGFQYGFRHPLKSTDRLDIRTQPLVQIHTQMIEKASSLGQALSQNHSFFVMHLPNEPHRAFISRIYNTLLPSKREDKNAKNNALYTMYCFVRIACDKKLSEEFLSHIAKLPVLYPSNTEGPPVYLEEGCIDVGHGLLSLTADYADENLRTQQHHLEESDHGEIESSGESTDEVKEQLKDGDYYPNKTTERMAARQDRKAAKASAERTTSVAVKDGAKVKSKSVGAQR